MKTIRWLLLLGLLVLALGLGAGTSFAQPRWAIAKFEGEVISRPEEVVGTWQIGEQEVMVDEGTVLIEEKGPAEVGAMVRVIAERKDGTLRAMIIRVLDPNQERHVYIYGVVSEMGEGYLVANQIRIRLTEQTTIEGELEVGAWVKVEARVQGMELVAVHIAVRSHHTPSVITFRGVVERISEDLWVISGREVAVNEDTVIIGNPQVGDSVLVRARVLSDGSLVALRIVALNVQVLPEEVEFEGIIQRFPPNLIGRWIISGRDVWVTPQTEISGTPQIGLGARVKALRYANGRLVALDIQIEEPAEDVYRGIIRRLPPHGLIGRWIIGEWQVLVLPGTRIEGTPAVGLPAEFKAYPQGLFGVLIAKEIKVLEPEEVTPTPLPTVVPRTATPTRLPSITPHPRHTPFPTIVLTRTPGPHSTPTPRHPHFPHPHDDGLPMRSGR